MYATYRRQYTTRVSTDNDARKLNAIVGAAIKAMAETGADDEVVGAFAASHRIKVAHILGQNETVPAAPDLVEIVTQAVANALNQNGLVSTPSRSLPTVRRFNVEVSGKRTSLTLSATAIAKLEQATGTRKAAKAVIQGFADSAPTDVPNRSGWVEERLAAYMLQLDRNPSTEVRH